MTPWEQIVQAYAKPVDGAMPARQSLPLEKLCTKCREVKPRSEFFLRTDKPNPSLVSHCKECLRKKKMEKA